MDISELKSHLDTRLDRLESKLDLHSEKLELHAQQIAKTETNLVWVRGVIKLGSSLLLGIISTVGSILYHMLRK